MGSSWIWNSRSFGATASALGDDGRHQRYIKTVHGRGYRFSAELSVTPVASRTEQRPYNLPAERTRLHGRDNDIEAVSELVGNHRLTTLLGIGGIGKTRLAVAVGRAVQDRFVDGVGFVDLTPLDARCSLAVAVADAASLELGHASVDGLAAELRDRDLLLILDNCEHIRAEVASFVDQVLTATNGLRILATSREPLDLLDEHRVAVLPLNGAAAPTLIGPIPGGPPGSWSQP